MDRTKRMNRQILKYKLETSTLLSQVMERTRRHKISKDIEVTTNQLDLIDMYRTVH